MMFFSWFWLVNFSLPPGSTFFPIHSTSIKQTEIPLLSLEKSHISLEKPWVPVDFLLQQSHNPYLSIFINIDHD